MFKNKFLGYVLCVCVLVSMLLAACASAPATPPARIARERPTWVTDVHSVFDRSRYIAAIGTGRDLRQAEMSAFGNLTAVFGQSIQVSETLTTSYHELVRSGAAAQWTETTALESAIQVEAGLDILLGAEIRERFDDLGTWYAAAVMDRARAAQLYSEIIRANLALIEGLTAMSPAERNSIEGLVRFRAAATVADVNFSYGQVLLTIGAPAPGVIRDGSDFRLEADTILRNITIGVTVRNDRNNRVRDSFTKIFTDQGFRSSGATPRYRLDAELLLSQVDSPNPATAFSRFEINANLIDTRTNAVLIPFNINGREGHRNLSEAENRAVIVAERRINEEYARVLSDFLSRLLP